jgi:hypothetical protein
MHGLARRDTVQARIAYLSIDLLRAAVCGTRRNEVYDIRALSRWLVSVEFRDVRTASDGL